jgi:hypothetical protein
MTITVNNYIVMWNPRNPLSQKHLPGLIQVAELGNNIYWDQRFLFSGGMCYVPRRSLSREGKIAMMFIDFHTCIVRDGVKPKDAHREFLKIEEYKTSISLDIEGAVPGDGVF